MKIKKRGVSNNSVLNTEDIRVNGGIVEIDVHGLNKYQAKIYIDHYLKKAGRDVYKLRIIHGFHGGTEIKSMIRGIYAKNPKVKRIEYNMNQGETELILRELY